MTCELVKAQEADIPGIVTLMNNAFRGSRQSQGWNTEAGYITGNRTTESLLREEIAEKPAACMLIWRDESHGALRGCVWLEPLVGDLWYLGSLTVDPQRQNGGLGHLLLSSAEQWISRARWSAGANYGGEC